MIEITHEAVKLPDEIPDEIKEIVRTLSNIVHSQCMAPKSLASTAEWSLSANKDLANFLAEASAKIESAKNMPYVSGKVETVFTQLPLNAAGLIKKLEKRRPFLEKRLDHAVSALKRKGLYADSLDGIADICDSRGLNDIRALVQIVRCNMGDEIIAIGDAGELDEGTWKIGIEIAVALEEPDLLESDELFAFFLTRQLRTVYACVTMAAYASKLMRLIRTGDFDEDVMMPLLNRCLAEGKMGVAISSALADELERHEKEFKDAAANERRRAEKAEKRIAFLEEQLAELRKESLPAVRAAQKAGNEKETLESRIAELERESNLLRDAIDARDRRISELSLQTAETDEDLPPLPEKGVIFAGGHPNLVWKIKEAHPEWSFIEGARKKTFSIPTAPFLVIYWAGHISHTAWWTIRSALPPGTPSIYVSDTNMDALEAAMRRGWAAAMPPDKNTARETDG